MGRLLEVALVEHGTRDSRQCWINTRAGRAPAAAGLVPNSTPAPESATPLVAIAQHSAITSIKENDLR